MKTCKGCGVELQDLDEIKVGYVKDLKQDYCQRCFRLTHYNDTTQLKRSDITNELVREIYRKHKDDLFVVIIDVFETMIFNIDSLINEYKDKKVILIVNKIDLLPRNITDNKIDYLITNVLTKSHHNNIITCILTNKHDEEFRNVFFDTLNAVGYKSILFVGRSNVGKSTIINKILGDNKLTTSVYPGTTVTVNRFKVNDYEFIDTPGLEDNESLINYIDIDKLNKLVPVKTIKSKNFQIYEKQSYIIEGICRIDINPKKLTTLKLFISNDLNVHRTSDPDKYLENNLKDIKLKLTPFTKESYKNISKSSYLIKGLGIVEVIGECDIDIYTYSKIKTYKCEVNI